LSKLTFFSPPEGGSSFFLVAILNFLSSPPLRPHGGTSLPFAQPKRGGRGRVAEAVPLGVISAAPLLRARPSPPCCPRVVRGQFLTITPVRCMPSPSRALPHYFPPPPGLDGGAPVDEFCRLVKTRRMGFQRRLQIGPLLLNGPFFVRAGSLLVPDQACVF